MPSRRSGTFRAEPRAAAPARKESRVRNLCQPTSNVTPLFTVLAWTPAADAVPRGYCIGYGRVSTRDQNPDSQRDALKAAGCDEIFINKDASGLRAPGPAAGQAATVRPGAEG